MPEQIYIDVILNKASITPDYMETTLPIDVSMGVSVQNTSASTVLGIYEEQLTGINGIKTIFTTTYPFKSNSINLYINGLKQIDFSEISSNQIEIGFAPLNEGNPDIVIINYERIT